MKTGARMGDASMTCMDAGNYNFMMVEFLIGRGPRYGGRFDSREGIDGALLLPKGEPVGGYVFFDEDCRICSSGEMLLLYRS